MSRSDSGQPYDTASLPRPGLLVLTGASHSGKSSVSAAIAEISPDPVAQLSVDTMLEQTIRPSRTDRWEEIPLAYDLIEAQLPILLGRKWPVIVESTFTYVTADGAGALHPKRLAGVVEIATCQGVPWLVCQLQADAEVLAARARETGRTTPEIVAETARIHFNVALPVPARRLRSDQLPPDEIAKDLISQLQADS